MSYREKKKSIKKGLRDGKTETYKYGMAEFMPADGEEFERYDHQSCAWDGPQTEKNYRINDYLYVCLQHIKAGEDIDENAPHRAQ